jgi:hypothetical protein
MSSTELRPTSAPRKPAPASPMGALTNVLLLAGIVSAMFILVTLIGLGGWTYYRTPLGVRGYVPAHRYLRPSGPAGQVYGIAGMGLLLSTLLYTVRKKLRKRTWLGPQKTWLEAHIFCGLVGPVLITLHSSFKFNGVISVAYWSMVLVVLSGFVGRYLYVRVPKSIRGTELTYEELTQRAAELGAELSESPLPPKLADRIAEVEKRALPGREHAPTYRGLFLGDLRLKRDLHRLRERSGVGHARLTEILGLIRERTTLLRRIAYLGRTKKLFALWHVFHQPLVYLMLAIAAIHVAVALYMGYSLIGW